MKGQWRRFTAAFLAAAGLLALGVALAPLHAQYAASDGLPEIADVALPPEAHATISLIKQILFRNR